MADKKRINLIFFQLIPEHSKKEELKERNVELVENMKSLVKKVTNTITTENSIISLNPKILFKDNLIIGSFVKTQMTDIPPKYNPSNNTTNELTIEEDEGLGYSTSFVFEPETRIIMVESIKNAVTISQICKFLNLNFVMKQINPHIVIDPVRMEEFTNMNTITRVRLKIAKIENGSLFNSETASLNKILNAADDTNLDEMEINLIKKKKGFSLDLNYIKGLVLALLKYKASNEVSTLKVSGQVGDYAKVSTIDLIEQKLVDYIDVDKYRVNGNFQLDRKYTKLQEVMNQHKKTLQRVYK